jgi:hypothetical protein
MLENQLSRYGAIAKQVPFTAGKVFFVVQSDDDIYGDFQNEFPADKDGLQRVYTTIQGAIDAAALEPDPAAGHVILIKPAEMAAGATDPTSFAEVLTIAAAQANLQLIGLIDNRTQGGLPQIRKGSGSTALLTVRAPGCLIKNLGFNGASATGGGILLDDDGSTKSAFGTTIENCHFKNCKGSTATSAATGGAIQWSSSGNAWQVLIKGCRFYKNVGDIVVLGTGGSVPQDVVIEDCVFSGPAANTDCNIYTGGSGVNGLIIRNCVFTAMPALSSGANVRYVDLTGSVGIMANCYFASIVSPTGSEGTFAAAGTLAKVPATVFIAGCYGETTTTGETGEIFRT